MNHKEKICSFSKVEITFDNVYLRELWQEESFLEDKDNKRLSQMLENIDKKIYELEHVKSVIERILLRAKSIL